MNYLNNRSTGQLVVSNKSNRLKFFSIALSWFAMCSFISIQQHLPPKHVKTILRYALLKNNQKVLDGIYDFYEDGKPKTVVEFHLNGDTSQYLTYTLINDSTYLEKVWSNRTVLYKTTNIRFYKKGTNLLKRIKEAKNYNTYFKYNRNDNLIEETHNDELNLPYDYYTYTYDANHLLSSKTDYYIVTGSTPKSKVKLDTLTSYNYTYTFFSNGAVKTRARLLVKERKEFRDYETDNYGKVKPVIKSTHLLVHKLIEIISYTELGEELTRTVYRPNGEIFSEHSYTYVYY